MALTLPDYLSMTVAAAAQLCAAILTVRMLREVRDRRPWVVLLIAMFLMLSLRVLVFFITPAQRINISPVSAPTISLLLCVSLFFIRRIARAERESDNRYRALVEHSPDTIFVDVDGRFVYVNPAGVKFFAAATEQELLGRPTTDFAAPTDPDPLTADALPQRWTKRDGAIVGVEVASVAIPWQGGRG